MSETKTKKKMKTKHKVIISVVSVILVIAIVALICLVDFAKKNLSYNYNEITEDPKELGFETVIEEKITNIALFGVDTRNPKSFKGLSDAIMILSINEKTKKVKVISIMRDTLVPLEYKGKTMNAKINSAYSRGGPELAIKTINTLFGLDISEYATVNFYGMADIIDAVGGIEVELAKNEVGYELNFGIKEVCRKEGIPFDDYLIDKAGKQTLNGIQAVSYARMRHTGTIWGTNNDYGRTDRQRYVMEQLFNKALTLEKSRYIPLARALLPFCETSLSLPEIIKIASNVLVDSPTFEQARVPMKDYQMQSKNIKGVGACVYYDLDYAGKVIRAFIYDDIKPSDYIAEHGVEKNDWYNK